MHNETSGGRWISAAEAAILAVVFTLILYLGPGAASGHMIRHDSPAGYAASDSFQHQARSEAIKGMGQYRNEAPYIVAGLTNVVGFYPPITYHITVLFSHLSGLETYDSLFFIIGLALAASALVIYYFTKSLGKAAAVLALPLALLVATGKPFLGMVTFGQMPFALSSLFLVAAAWAITKLALPKIYLLAAVFIAGTIMTHTSETMFFGIIVAAALLLPAISKVLKEKLSGIKALLLENSGLAAAFMIAALMAIYFLPIFLKIWLKLQPYRFSVESTSASFPAATVFPTDFGFMLLPIIIGLAAAILLFIQKRDGLGRLLKSPELFTLAFSAYMLVAGLGTYFGFGLRSFQTRLFWPITLAPLAGFGIYQLLRIALKFGSKNISAFAAAAAVAAALSASVLAVYYEAPSGGTMDRDHWEPMAWIAENTPKDAKVFMLYSHVYSQTSSTYNTERVNYFLELPDFAGLINGYAQKNSFDRKVRVTVPSDSGAQFPYRKGILSFGQLNDGTMTGGVVDICSADYYVADLAFPQEQLAQAAMLLAQKFMAANMTIVYQNPAVIVLRNNNFGGDCLGK